MMTSYELYGIAAPTLEDARGIAERALGITMSHHESSWCGDYFRTGSTGGEHFVLRQNYDPVEEEWTEPCHKTSTFLLYLNETTRAAVLRDLLGRLPQVTHLRSGRA